MGTHIKVVALLNIIRGAFGLLGAVGVLIGGTLGSLMSGSFVGAIAGTIGSVIGAVIVGALSAFCVAAGFGLLNGKPWARIAVIVLSVLGLFNFPLGTILGGYSLWVLFNDETKRTFGATGQVV